MGIHNSEEKISLPAHLSVKQNVVDGILECKKNSKGHFGTFVCVLKKPKQTSLWRHLFEEGYEKIYSNPKKLFLFDCLLLLGILCAGLTALYIFFFGVGVAKYVELSIALSPENLKNGSAARITVNYNNKSETAIDNTEIALRLPAGFVVQEVAPQTRWNPTQKTFSLGKIPARKGGQVELEGTFIIDPRFKENVHATLTFNEENKRRVENKLASKNITVRESVFSAHYELPPAVIKNNWFTVTSTITNHAKLLLNNVALTPTPALVASATPALENGRWRVEEWPQGVARQFVMNIQENNNGNDVITTLTPHVELNNEIIIQPTEAATVTVINPHVQVTLHENWGSAFEFNTPHVFTISVKNEGQWSLPSWRLSLTSSEAVRVTTGSGTVSQNGNLITWNNGADPLDPGETATVEGAFMIPNKNNKASLTFTPQLEYTLNYNGSFLQGVTQGTTKNIASITPPDIYAEARYFNTFGDQLGRGPLPPRVGAETKYWLHWAIKGGSKPLRSAEVRAQLPSYVTPTGKGSVSRGQAAIFEESTRRMLWRAPQLNPQESISVFFEVSVTPEKIHKGKELLLMSETTLTGTDLSNESPITAQSPYPITSILYNDTYGKAYGGTVEE